MGSQTDSQVRWGVWGVSVGAWLHEHMIICLWFCDFFLFHSNFARLGAHVFCDFFPNFFDKIFLLHFCDPHTQLLCSFAVSFDFVFSKTQTTGSTGDLATSGHV